MADYDSGLAKGKAVGAASRDREVWYLKATIVALLACVCWLWSPTDRVYPVSEEMRADAPGEFVKVGVVRTHYTIQGKGPLIVLVHGLGTGWDEAYNHIIPVLAEKNTVLAYDYYGRGYTDGASDNHDMEQLCGHLAELLLQLSGRTNGLTVQPFTLVGYSMGGALVTGFATQYPHLIKNLVLMAPAGVGIPIPIEGQIIQIPIIGDLLFQLLGKLIMQMQLPKGHFEGEDMSEDIRQWRIQRLNQRVEHSQGHISGILSSIRHFPLNGFDAGYAALQKLPFPVMAIWGEDDLVCPFGAASTALKKLVPKLELKPIKECGHDDLVEKDASKTAALIDEFANRK
mmetsp:Transcript_13023/g.24636  ORF Transcript_13023/g.24636 Transcript_13023/m.24636 type:complete len:343 (-) Transcript_13023:68-1096(-)|eukprot:CAMPEP_0167782758 /NCGR_PEP_ID=MMETSP0111_2-20121227/6696_1 /TAXON_ID=91324 /ORGANISM="Lotharella globosa, Strain CCCM811" /LENGTH=342 /DNA_ID=CAMNT_0007673627 /DNA_START=40 /DNA_END=1068 /DNA_ORIENTATION=+